MDGTPGIGGGSCKENLETGKRTYFSSKGRFVVGEGDIWVGTSSGGGGYGDALERDPEAVLESVFDGLLSLESAEDVYGVVINRAMMTIDLAGTQALRAKMAAKRGPLQVTSPNRPRRRRLDSEEDAPGRRIPRRRAIASRRTRKENDDG